MASEMCGCEMREGGRGVRKGRKDTFPKPFHRSTGVQYMSCSFQLEWGGAGRGLATPSCEQGRAVGLPMQQKWALETTGPGFKPGSIMFCCVTTSLSFVFVISNLELLGPILYSSWKSLIRCCFRRSQLHPGTHTGGPRGYQPLLLV